MEFPDLEEERGSSNVKKASLICTWVVCHVEQSGPEMLEQNGMFVCGIIASQWLGASKGNNKTNWLTSLSGLSRLPFRPGSCALIKKNSLSKIAKPCVKSIHPSCTRDTEEMFGLTYNVPFYCLLVSILEALLWENLMTMTKWNENRKSR